MAEKPEDQFNDEDIIARAKELYAIGCRNYYVRNYAEAADDLSEASKLFGEVYGIDGAEVGDVYLMYAKSLIAIGQGENKVVDVPDDEEEEDDDEVEPASKEEGDGAVEDEKEAEPSEPAENGIDESSANGHAENDPEPGTSKITDEEEAADAEGDEEEGGNLEVAWEVLQNAAMIFERVGGNKLKSLMDTYAELAEISLENSNFDAALSDFNKALAVFEDLDEADQNQRVVAEIHYKSGLCHMMEKRYDESMKSFQKAADIFEEVLAREKSREDQTEEDKAKIKDLEEIQQELINKIIEVRDTKAEELEFVKREMMKMYGSGNADGSSDAGAGSSSSSSFSAGGSGSSSLKSPISTDGKPKPTDISHLIKRKKPDSDPIQESPAKKQVLETSPGEKIAIATEKVVETDEDPKVLNLKTVEN